MAKRSRLSARLAATWVASLLGVAVLSACGAARTAEVRPEPCTGRRIVTVVNNFQSSLEVHEAIPGRVNAGRFLGFVDPRQSGEFSVQPGDDIAFWYRASGRLVMLNDQQSRLVRVTSRCG